MSATTYSLPENFQVSLAIAAECRNIVKTSASGTLSKDRRTYFLNSKAWDHFERVGLLADGALTERGRDIGLRYANDFRRELAAAHRPTP